jgi:hypothetical protein
MFFTLKFSIFQIILLLICLYIETVMIAKVEDFRPHQSFDPNSFWYQEYKENYYFCLK